MSFFDYFKTKYNNYIDGINFEDYERLAKDSETTTALKYRFYNLDNDDASGEKSRNVANLTNSMGLSLLQLAAENYNSDAVEEFIKHGADVNYNNSLSIQEQYTPLALALKINEIDNKQNNENVLHLIGFEPFKKTVDLLLKNGGYALRNSDFNFTEKQKINNTEKYFNQFFQNILDENICFFNTNDDNQTVFVPTTEVLDYLFTTNYLHSDNINIDTLIKSRQNSGECFEYLFDKFEHTNSKELLRTIHKKEAEVISNYVQEAVNLQGEINNLLDNINADASIGKTTFGCVCLNTYQNKKEKVEQKLNKTIEGHIILTNLDDKGTFDFDKPKNYPFSYVNGKVLYLLDYEKSIEDYKKEYGADAEKKYDEDFLIAFPFLTNDELPYAKQKLNDANIFVGEKE